MIKILLISLLYINFANADESIAHFVSLKGKDVNLRNGPGEEYRIIITYHKNYMPLRVLHRIDNWYLITDYQGASGWVKVNMVTSNVKMRKVIFKKQSSLCFMPVLDKGSCNKIGSVESGVVATLKYCNTEWCRVVFNKIGLSGWVERSNVWGISDEERF